MEPTSESLSPSETRSRWVAKDYCAAAMPGGELSEAKEGSQTKVISIRPMQKASWRKRQHLPGTALGGVGEAWA
jgi:hypothetical protein